MANTAHLVRRQSSRDLNSQRSLDRLELKEMKGRLMPTIENGGAGTYGATNVAFEDSSPSTKIKSVCSSKRGSQVVLFSKYSFLFYLHMGNSKSCLTITEAFVKTPRKFCKKIVHLKSRLKKNSRLPDNGHVTIFHFHALNKNSKLTQLYLTLK